MCSFSESNKKADKKGFHFIKNQIIETKNNGEISTLQSTGHYFMTKLDKNLYF